MQTDISVFRNQLLALHKALLDVQKEEYEGNNKKVTSPAQYFSLVTEHPDFQWLRELSAVIVSIDELEANAEATQEQKQEAVLYIKRLLTAQKTGNVFEQKYFHALQNYPFVGVLHGQLLKHLE